MSYFDNFILLKKSQNYTVLNEKSHDLDLEKYYKITFFMHKRQTYLIGTYKAHVHISLIGGSTLKNVNCLYFHTSNVKKKT